MRRLEVEGGNISFKLLLSRCAEGFAKSVVEFADDSMRGFSYRSVPDGSFFRVYSGDTIDRTAECHPSLIDQFEL